MFPSCPAAHQLHTLSVFRAAGTLLMIVHFDIRASRTRTTTTTVGKATAGSGAEQYILQSHSNHIFQLHCLIVQFSAFNQNMIKTVSPPIGFQSVNESTRDFPTSVSRHLLGWVLSTLLTSSNIYVPSRQLCSSSILNSFCRNKFIWLTLFRIWRSCCLEQTSA